MKQAKWMAAGMAFALMLGGAGPVSAQQANGSWWSWALGDALGVTGRGPGSVVLDPTRSGRRGDDKDGAARSSGRTVGDIIFGRSGGERGKSRDGRDRDPAGRGRSQAAGRGPAFCRNGVGHPTKGRQWCVDKGFGLGGGGLLNGVWREDRGWGGVILGGPSTRVRSGSVLGQGGLRDVLGSVILGRLQNEQRRLGARAPLQGRWLREGAQSLVLQVRAGNTPVAELTDLNGDGRADVVLVARP